MRFEDTFLGRRLYYTNLAEQMMTDEEKKMSRERESQVSAKETYEFIRKLREPLEDDTKRVKRYARARVA